MRTQIINLNKLNDKLDNLSTDTIKRAITKSCLLVEEVAKKECPVDDGQLRQSITSEIVSDTEGAVGTNVFYAPYVHQGTGIYAVNGDGRKTMWRYQDAKGEWHSTVGQKPNPFLERALDQSTEDIKNIFIEEIRSDLK